MGATEIVQALVSPAEKLIDTVRGAIGKVYEPRYVRKMADAEAYRIKKLGEATAEAAMDIPVIFEKDGLSLDGSDLEALAARTSSRLFCREMKKQQNIEAITGYAYQELENAEPVTNEPVDPDWITQFFNLAENVSNEDIQKIWGRILAGEIKRPNSYSYRTLECLKKMTKEEIALLQETAPIALHARGGIYFILKNTLSVIFLTSGDLRILTECGLLLESSREMSDFVPLAETSFFEGMAFHSRIAINFDFKQPEIQEIQAFTFTSSGTELLKIATENLTGQDLDDGADFILRYLCRLQNRLPKKNPPHITAHRIRSFAADGTPEYDEEDILATYDPRSGYHP